MMNQETCGSFLSLLHEVLVPTPMKASLTFCRCRQWCARLVRIREGGGGGGGGEGYRVSTQLMQNVDLCQ